MEMAVIITLALLEFLRERRKLANSMAKEKS